MGRIVARRHSAAVIELCLLLLEQRVIVISRALMAILYGLPLENEFLGMVKPGFYAAGLQNNKQPTTNLQQAISPANDELDINLNSLIIKTMLLEDKEYVSTIKADGLTTKLIHEDPQHFSRYPQ